MFFSGSLVICLQTLSKSA